MHRKKIEATQYTFLPKDIYNQIPFSEDLNLISGHITLIEAVDKSGNKTIFAEAYKKDIGFISQRISTDRTLEDINAEIGDIMLEAAAKQYEAKRNTNSSPLM